MIRKRCVVNNLENDTDKQMEHPEDVLAVSAIVQCPIRRFLPSMFMLTDAGPQLPSPQLTQQVPFPKGCHESQQCCTSALGTKVPKGRNLFNIISLSPHPDNAFQYCMHSVKTINIGGNSFPRLVTDTICAMLALNTTGKSNWQRTFPLQFHAYSPNQFGSLNYELVNQETYSPGLAAKCESALEGDSIPVFEITQAGAIQTCFENLDITAQELVAVQSSDFAFGWALNGLDDRFRHCKFKCEFCEAEACHLAAPWEQLQQHPPERTMHSFQQNWLTQSKGVVRKPIIVWPVERVSPRVMHAMNGTWNTGFKKVKSKFAAIIDEKILKQDPTFARLELEVKQLKGEIEVVKTEIKNLRVLKQNLLNKQSLINIEMQEAVSPESKVPNQLQRRLMKHCIQSG